MNGKRGYHGEKEVKKMAEIPQDMKKLLFGRGAKWQAWNARVLPLVGSGCLIVGIVGDATNRTLGLEPTNWFIMAVAYFVGGFWGWICAYTAAKEG